MPDRFVTGKQLGTEPGTQVDSWGGRNEYWLPLRLRPLLGKKSESCITVCPVTRTAVMLAYSWLKVLMEPADIGRMLA